MLLELKRCHICLLYENISNPRGIQLIISMKTNLTPTIIPKKNYASLTFNMLKLCSHQIRVTSPQTTRNYGGKLKLSPSYFSDI